MFLLSFTVNCTHKPDLSVI